MCTVKNIGIVMEKLINISVDDALELCSRAEDDFFDKKSIDIDGKGIQKIVVAFANADGGEFVVGVEDEKRKLVDTDRWSGQENPEKFNGILQAIFCIKSCN